MKEQIKDDDKKLERAILDYDFLKNELDTNPDFLKYSNSYGFGLLHLIAFDNNNYDVRCLNLLLTSEIDSASKCKYNRTALHYACRYGKLDVVKALIEVAPETLKIKDKDNKTPLDLAIREKYQYIVDYIKKYIDDNQKIVLNAETNELRNKEDSESSVDHLVLKVEHLILKKLAEEAVVLFEQAIKESTDKEDNIDSSYGKDSLSAVTAKVHDTGQKAKKVLDDYSEDDVEILIESLLKKKANNQQLQKDDTGVIRFGANTILPIMHFSETQSDRFTAEVNFLATEMSDERFGVNHQILVPIIISGHWITLRVIRTQTNLISFSIIDSLGDTRKQVLKRLETMLMGNDWKNGLIKIVSQDYAAPIIQRSGNYCGGYTARLISTLVANPKINFNVITIWGCSTSNEGELREEDRNIVNEHKPVNYTKFGKTDKRIDRKKLESSSNTQIESEQLQRYDLLADTTSNQLPDSPLHTNNYDHIFINPENPDPDIEEVTKDLQRANLEEEGYYTDFDDSSDDESTIDAENYNVDEHVSSFMKLKNSNFHSFISQAIALKLLYSKKVNEKYKKLKKELLRNKTNITQDIGLPIKAILHAALKSILENQEPHKDKVVAEFLETQSLIIVEIENAVQNSIIKVLLNKKDNNKESIKIILNSYCKALLEVLSTGLNDHIRSYDIPQSISKYMSKLSKETLREKLRDHEFYELTAGDINILRNVEILTDYQKEIRLKSATAESGKKKLKTKYDALKKDHPKLKDLSLLAKALVETLKEHIPSSIDIETYKQNNKVTLLDKYVDLLHETATRQGVIEEGSNFKPEKYQDSVFNFEGINKKLFANQKLSEEDSAKKLTIKGAPCEKLIDKIATGLVKEGLVVTNRKTLSPMSHFNIQPTDEDENLFADYLATLRISYRSIRREVKNKENAKKLDDFMVDSVLVRHWIFQHDGSEYIEQQTLNEYLTRVDSNLFGSLQTGTSYEKIVEFLSKIKAQLNKQYIVDDAKIAKHIRAIFYKKSISFDEIYGSNREDYSRIINQFEKQQINSMITRVAGLIFGTEVQRHPAAFIHSHMLLDLIEKKLINFEQAFCEYINITEYDGDNKNYFRVENFRGKNYWFPVNYGHIYTYENSQLTEMIIEKKGDKYIIKNQSTQSIISIFTIEKPKNDKSDKFKIVFNPLMPMAPTGATSMAVKMNKDHNTKGMPFKYIHNGAENDYDYLEEAEIYLVNFWLEKIVALPKQDMVDSGKVVKAIQNACVDWCGIDISPHTSKKNVNSLNLRMSEKFILLGLQEKMMQERFDKSSYSKNLILPHVNTLLLEEDLFSFSAFGRSNANVEQVGHITLIKEVDHSLNHKDNISKLIKMFNDNKIQQNTFICLERKQYGNNLGMRDVTELAHILQSKSHKEQQYLPEYMQQLPIYYDAFLYNIAQSKAISVIGIEGKGLAYSKESPYYHQAREEYMAEQLLAIARSGKNAIFLIGAAHINNLIKLLGEQGFRVDDSDISLGQNLITLKSDQAIFTKELALPEVSAELIRITNHENIVETISQPETENIEVKTAQPYSFLSYIHEFTEQLDLNWQIQKLLYLTDLWKFESLKEKYGIIASFDAFRGSNSDFRKSVLLKLHPDKNPGKQDCNDDFVFVTNLREELNKPFDVQKYINERIQAIQPIIYKANIGFKVFDTTVDTARLIYIPTADNAKKVLIDSTYLYSMYSGINGISTMINGVDIAYKIYQGEYTQALTQGLTTAGYMLVPVAISFVAIPYVGFIYGATLTIYSGYGAITNAYSFYQECYEDGFGLRSITAYKNLFKTLSNSPLQYVYNFNQKTKDYKIKLNHINLELEKTHAKKQLEEKGEFGQKIYKYIYSQMIEEKYELLNKVIQGILTQEESDNLRAKHIKIINYDHCVEVIDLKEEQADHYYCYNEEQEILDHIVIIGEAYIEKISSL